MNESSGPAGGRSSVELEWICRSTLQATFPFFRNTDLRACFYPYIGLTHTIRRRKGGWLLRISDHCSNAPRVVLEAITVILACKVLRRRPPTEVVRAYDLFRRNPAIEAAVDARRLSRGRKVFLDTAGSHHSLVEIYQDVNRLFFNCQVEIRRLGWSSRRSWGRLGHYDPVHHTITVSPVLDSPRVPRAVVAYILYHEMLHTLFDNSTAGTRKRHHSPEFRKTERSYPAYPEIKRFLDRFCQTRGRQAVWNS